MKKLILFSLIALISNGFFPLVMVAQYGPCEVSFTVDDSNAPTIAFLNTTNPFFCGPVTIRTWDFGDLTQDQTNTDNPSHTYQADGTYTVCLILSSQEFFIGSTCMPIDVCTPAKIAVNPTNQLVCPAESVSFNSSYTSVADSLRWQVSTNGGGSWSNLSDGPNYSGTTTTVLTVQSPSLNMNGYEYRMVVYSCEDKDDISASASLNVQMTSDCFEVDVVYKSISITDGDNSPSPTDGTHFREVCGMEMDSFYIKNLKFDFITIDGIFLEIYHSNPGKFTYNDLDFSFPDTILSGDSLVLKITFNPLINGADTVRVLINNNDLDEGSYDFLIAGVKDTTDPTASCLDTTIYLDAAGMALIDSSFVDSSSRDNCDIATIGLSRNVFSCSDVGTQNVIVTVTDENGNTSTCMSTVTVRDTTPPLAVCVDTSVFLDATGQVIIDSSFVDNESADNCKIDSIRLNRYHFDCQNVGENTVTLTVYDANGNSAVCTSKVTVLDTFPPIALCIDTSVFLNATGQVIIDSSFVDNESTDNCEIDSIRLNRYHFDCQNVGENTVTMTVYDANGNSAVCTSKVTVLDTFPPIALCIDTSVFLNATGQVIIDSSFVDNESTDNCEIDSIRLNRYHFDCQNVGENTVTMTVYDANGNSAVCTSKVTVLDTFPPIALCIDTSVFLNATGQVTIDSSFVDKGNADNCKIDSIRLNRYHFDCQNVGENTVTMTVYDVNGNSAVCTSKVTVLDTFPPIALCIDTSIFLNATGQVIIDSSFVDNESADNCKIDSIRLNRYHFDCQNVGENTVTLTVYDVNGNSAVCTSKVTVLDTFPPIALCIDTSIFLDATGQVIIDSSFVDNESADNCKIDSIRLNRYHFDCQNVGENTVTMTVYDVNGNSAVCTSKVTVLDTFPPIALCIDTSVFLDATGQVIIDSSFVDNESADNCEIDSIRLNRYHFDCQNVGENTVTMTVYDANGNSAVCTSKVTVLDTFPPIALCIDTSVFLDATGQVIIDSSFVDNGSADNCEIDSIRLSRYQFNCQNVGENTVAMTVYDVNGNSAVCITTVTVRDIAIIDAVINGPSTVCPQLQKVPFSISEDPLISWYSWSYSGNGVTINGDSSAHISLDFSAAATAGNLHVKLLTACGNTAGQADLGISMGSAAFCELASCLRESIFVDNELLALENAIEVFKASDRIETDVNIKGSRTIVFKAGNEIVYFPPFSVERGATHTAQIESCAAALNNDEKK